VSDPVAVQLLDREYLVACSEDERADLQAAAQLLDRKMRDIRGNNRMAGLDRIAVLAALNLAHELSRLRRESSQRDTTVGRALGELNQRLDRLLDAAEPSRPG
jgi:cell division protein ZapA